VRFPDPCSAASGGGDLDALNGGGMVTDPRIGTVYLASGPEKSASAAVVVVPPVGASSRLGSYTALGAPVAVTSDGTVILANPGRLVLTALTPDGVPATQTAACAGALTSSGRPGWSAAAPAP
jgi:hypothetical protein